MEKVMKVVTNILYIFLAAVVLLEAAVIVPKLFGIRPLAVLSGSMEPAYHVGSMVYVGKTDAADIQVGDVITFYMAGDTMTTHRVVAKDEEAGGFTTKGDANNTEDGGLVPYDKVVGRVVFDIPYLGYVSSYLSSRPGSIVVITLIIVTLIFSFLPGMFKEAGKEKEEKKAEKENAEKNE